MWTHWRMSLPPSPKIDSPLKKQRPDAAFDGRATTNAQRGFTPRSYVPAIRSSSRRSMAGAINWGWNPESKEPVTDLGSKAAEPFSGRRFAVRIAPGLPGKERP